MSHVCLSYGKYVTSIKQAKLIIVGNMRKIVPSDERIGRLLWPMFSNPLPALKMKKVLLINFKSFIQSDMM